MEIKVALDTVWVLFASMLIFFMTLGFAMTESGFVRVKNCVNVLSKNLIAFAISSIGFLILGWGLMFGDGNDLIGMKGLFLLRGYDNSPATEVIYNGVYSAINWAPVPLYAKFFFQLTFCGITTIIVSGAVAERIRYKSFIIFSFIMSMFIYPVVGHWIWGKGWLAKLGMVDFAGSTVVHSVSGWAALSGILLIGPRFGKYLKDGRINPLPGHNIPLSTIGTFILWFGWFGFNSGSTMAVEPKTISHIIVTTNISAASAILSSTITSWLLIGKPDLGLTLSGCIAGLVAITASCAFVNMYSAIIIGLCAGIIVILSIIGFDRLQIDDPVGILSIHLMNGIFGTLCVGLFAQKGITDISDINGLFLGGGTALLLAQLNGIIGVAIFTFIMSLIVWSIIKVIFGLRVTIQEEFDGLDISEHGNSAYPEFLIRKPGIFSGNGE